jgi:hypothetical protein
MLMNLKIVGSYLGIMLRRQEECTDNKLLFERGHPAALKTESVGDPTG